MGWISAVLLLLTAQVAAAQTVYYVAPTGNDGWTGTAADPAADNAGPFHTPERALKALAESRAAKPQGPVTIRFRGGTYTLASPVVLTPRHSGSKAAPVVLEAYGNETPLFSGGIQIGGWKPSPDHTGWWVAAAPGVRQGNAYFRDLWVDGRRATRARQPNVGRYLTIAAVPDASKDWTVGQTRFTFAASDVPGGPFPFGAEAVVASRWVESRLPFKSVDPVTRLAAFAKRSQFTMEAGDHYWLEGDLRWLDSPGEWYLDHRDGLIYYMPLPGQNPQTMQAIMPSVGQLVRLAGDPEHDRPIEYVTFRGLVFSHAHFNWADPDEKATEPASGGFAQADLPVPAAVLGDGLRHCTFERCRFVHTGTAGLELARGCQSNRISRCSFSDLAAGGIKLGEPIIRTAIQDQTFGNEISDCELADGGKRFTSAVALWVGQSSDNTIRYNHIHDFYYTGISLGWTWGYSDSMNRGNVVEHNHVHHIGRLSNGDGPLLSDMGGIYTLGARQGTVIRGNIFHDIASSKYGGWGIYLDEGSSDVLVSGNLVYNTNSGGFHLHYGANNLVTRNVFALGRDAQIQRTREEKHLSFFFTENVVYWPGGSPLLPGVGPQMTFSKNFYGPVTAPQFHAGDRTWEQWRAMGQEEETRFVGEIFNNPAAGDFTLTKAAAALQLPVSIPSPEQVGPRPLSR